MCETTTLRVNVEKSEVVVIGKESVTFHNKMKLKACNLF